MNYDNKIRVGITHGDINGVGYEVILKAFEDPTMLELCTPIIYGSSKAASYHRKMLNLQTSFSTISNVSEATNNKLYLIDISNDELKVEIG
nr:4-hydroxythreonine-4-phosphate dehydrogenase PdxA [Bacteroidaceae bacterium]